MAKVSQELSFTVNLGNYNSAKATVGIYDLDTDHDIEEQIESAKQALGKAFVSLYKLADAEANKAMDSYVKAVDDR